MTKDPMAGLVFKALVIARGLKLFNVGILGFLLIYSTGIFPMTSACASTKLYLRGSSDIPVTR